MSEEILDLIGKVLWIALLVVPFIVVIICWRKLQGPRWYRLMVGLVFAFVAGVVLYVLSLQMLFRHGIGP